MKEGLGKDAVRLALVASVAPLWIPLTVARFAWWFSRAVYDTIMEELAV